MKDWQATALAILVCLILAAILGWISLGCPNILHDADHVQYQETEEAE